MSAPTMPSIFPLDLALERAHAHAAALVESLSPEQLGAIAEGRGRLVYRAVEPAGRAHRLHRREPARHAIGVDVTTVVERINSLRTPGEVADYLAGLDARFTVPVLKEIARAIGPTVATTGRTKAQLHRDIVAGTAGFRTRSTAMSDGAWS